MRRTVLQVLGLGLLLAAPDLARAEQDHLVGVGYRSLNINSKQDKQFAFHSFDFAYSMYVGRRWGFSTIVDVGMPLGAKEGDEKVKVTELYAPRWTGDVFAAATHRIAFGTQRFDVMLGVHTGGIQLKSADEFIPFQHMSFGVGFGGRYAAEVSDRIIVHGSVVTAFDFVDFVHGKDLRSAFTVQAIVGAGIRLGTKRHKIMDTARRRDTEAPGDTITDDVELDRVRRTP